MHCKKDKDVTNTEATIVMKEYNRFCEQKYHFAYATEFPALALKVAVINTPES